MHDSLKYDNFLNIVLPINILSQQFQMLSWGKWPDSSTIHK